MISWSQSRFCSCRWFVQWLWDNDQWLKTWFTSIYHVHSSNFEPLRTLCVCVCVCVCVCSVSQSCLILCGPMECSLPGSSVHGISQARIPEWVALSYSRGSSRPSNCTQVSCIGRRNIYHHPGNPLRALIFIKQKYPNLLCPPSRTVVLGIK